MKSVMLSIQPKWCELIASGRKTIEVRKTAPKIDTPFKCYIYCTKDAQKHYYIDEYDDRQVELIPTKVIGDFECDYIDDIMCLSSGSPEGCPVPWYREVKGSCLTTIDLMRYGKGKILYAWHISDLKIYDTPKELSEFYTVCNKTGNDECNDCVYLRVARSSYPCDDDIDTWCGVDNKKPLTRPFQSWGYVCTNK